MIIDGDQAVRWENNQRELTNHRSVCINCFLASVASTENRFDIGYPSFLVYPLAPGMVRGGGGAAHCN